MLHLTRQQLSYGGQPEIPDPQDLAELARDRRVSSERQRARKIFRANGIAVDDPFYRPQTGPSPF